MRELSPKIFILIFVSLCLVFGLVPYIFSYVFLSKAYEHQSFEEIAKIQLESGAIYGSALNQSTFNYKLALIKAKRPEIIALGSSRVLQFRQEAFNTSFVSAGNAMNNLYEGELFVDKILQIYKPKFIILGLDFWWFNAKMADITFFPYHANTGDIMNLKKILSPLNLLIQNELTLKDIKRIFKNDLSNDLTTFSNMGLHAIKSSTGFRSDGSYLYANSIFGKNDRSGIIENEVNDARLKNGKYINGSVDMRRVDRVIKLIQKLESSGVKVIAFATPMSEPVSNAMQEIVDSYIWPLFSEIGKHTKIYNFLRPSSFGGENICEYIDGFHGGDVTYLRILKKIYDSSEFGDFNEFVNIDLVTQAILKYSGKALGLGSDDTRFLQKEVDFLHLGCKK